MDRDTEESGPPAVEDDCESVVSESEAIPVKIAKAPIKPSREEVESHMATHLPFRSWCPHCVRGKSKGKPHSLAKSTGKDMPTIVCDYMFMHESQKDSEE